MYWHIAIANNLKMNIFFSLTCVNKKLTGALLDQGQVNVKIRLVQIEAQFV